MIELKLDNQSFSDMIDDFNKSLAILKSYYIFELPLNQDGAAATSANCAFVFDWVRRALLGRVINLADNYSISVNTQESLVAALVGRAMMETISHFHHLLHKIENLLGNQEHALVYHLLARYMLAGGHEFKSHHKKLSKIHVNTALETIEKTYASFSETYAWLSEFCHPNALGSSLMFAKMVKADTSMKFFTKPDFEICLSPALEGTLYFPVFGEDWLRSEVIKKRIEATWKSTDEVFELFETD